MRSVRACIASFLVAILSVGVGGCVYTPTRSLAYTPTPIEVARPKPGLLVVRDLQEARPERLYSSSTGRMFLTYVPLIPYVTIPYERLDESDEMHREGKGESVPEDEHFTIAMTEVITNDLAASGLFREVRYIGDGPVPADADYVLEGQLESTAFDVYVTSYMLGMAGVLLWLLPLPMAKNEAKVDANLELRDRSGQVVWTDRLEGEGARIFTFYNSSGAPVTNRMMLEIKRYASNDQGIDGDSLWAYHAAALRSGMADVKASMRDFFDGVHPGD